MNIENGISSSFCSIQTLNKNLKSDKFIRPHIPIKTHLFNLYNEAKVHAVSIDYEYNSASKTTVLERMQCNNGLVAAILQAYNGHQHLRLTPDDIWLTIAQGVSHHVNLNVDKYKDRFVKRKSITIYNECILSVDPKTKCLVGDWPECIRQLLEATDKQIKKVDLQSLLECDFSTSSQNSIIPSRVVLLDTFHRSCSFQFNVFCGIPRVTLEGKLDDWMNIKERLVYLRKLFPDLEFWLDPLEQVILKLIETYRGQVDEEFWRGIAREDYGCGGPPDLTGWVTKLFPYDSSGNVVNNWIDEGKLPEGRVYIPFDVESGQKMKFVTGYLGVNQEVIENSDGEVIVSPVIGWAVIDEGVTSIDAHKHSLHELW